MASRVLQFSPSDNVLVALADLKKGEEIEFSGRSYQLASDVRSKHKFAVRDLPPQSEIVMYGVLVGKATQPIRAGEALTTRNMRHEAAAFHSQAVPFQWTPPDVSRWIGRTFSGYHRPDGQVGTRNYWLVVPLVFCENRNIAVLKQAFTEELGFAPSNAYRRQVAELTHLYESGRADQIRSHDFGGMSLQQIRHKLFPNVDGIKFLMHEGGCGTTDQDTAGLAGLIAGYIHHPNVAGATVLSLGCQKAQVSMLRAELLKRNPNFNKPLLVFDQQESGLESKMLSDAVRETFLGLVEANRETRTPAPLSYLSVGLKCGGSDGFSGISANPAVGHASDLLAALGGRPLLSEFPELCGAEQDLIDRSGQPQVGERFMQLMREYAARARAVNASFDMNPSPGNVADGLITDAMKSAGAAKKGGTSPVTAALDYPEYSTQQGLNLLCTPGSDVECVTAQVGAGANVVLFTTGLGTPTGNPIAPVVKISTNSDLARRMSDIIDADAGSIITGEKSVPQMGEEILECVVKVASGEMRTKAELLGQDDFVPWKRGVSL